MTSIGRFIRIVLLLPLALSAGGQTGGYDFLRIDFNPRSRAMAGAVFGRYGDVSTIRHNPAALTGSKDNFLSLNYCSYLLEINGGEVLYSHIIPSAGRISGTLTYFNYGQFDEVRFFDHPSGATYTANDLMFKLSWSGELYANLAYGIAIKYLHSTIHEYNSSVLAADLGTIWRMPFDQDLSLGLSVLNAGKSIDPFIEIREKLPLSVNAGISKRFAYLPLELNLGFLDLNQKFSDNRSWSDKIAIGGELDISGMVFIRAGYRSQLYHNKAIDQGYSGLSLGAGIEYNSYKFDYAYSSFGILGNSHMIGLVFHFSGGQSSERSDMEPELMDLPPIPEKFTAGLLTDTINFFWQEIPGYRINIYLRHTDDEQWTRLNDNPLSGNSAGYARPRVSGTYFFLLRAVSADGQEGPASDQIWLRFP